MEPEVSWFESSEMLATLLASTPLLEESWKLCSQANREAQQSYVIKQVGGVCYVAFSGVQNLSGFDPNCSFLVPIRSCGLFSGLHQEHVEDEGEEAKAATVHTGLLQLFLSFYNNPVFQSQIMEITSKSKSVVFSGHSVGGAIASLSALWLLSSLHSISSSLAVICITFGSPMLGNESFSKSILHERWGGNFLHVVGQHDIVPRLLFTPSARIIPHLHHFFDFWKFSMASQFFKQHMVQFFDERAAADLFHVVLSSLEELTKGIQSSLFWPFGSYIFCTDKGSISVDNAVSVVKLLYMLLGKSSPSSTIYGHLNYENNVSRIPWQILSSNDDIEGDLPESSYEAGITLALQSSDIAPCDPVFGAAKDCLKMAKQMGRTPSLNCANLAIGLSKITPLRAQIEWYKESCDVSDDQMGYYDAFKQRGASKKEFKVNMNRHKLARFWNDVISMLESNQLPHDFHKRLKWVNASHFYKLLVEPLDIAEYYKSGEHLRKGHYIEHGRPKRYNIFDKWWSNEEVSANPGNSRSNFASLTQDSCFWAKVEEARECLNRIQREGDARIQSLLLENINKFDQYARDMVDRKEVSIDVLAKNSSYKLFVEEWKKLKFQLQILPPHFPSLPEGEGSSSLAYIVGK